MKCEYGEYGYDCYYNVGGQCKFYDFAPCEEQMACTAVQKMHEHWWCWECDQSFSLEDVTFINGHKLCPRCYELLVKVESVNHHG
jgi:uncharacterized paraquat-inducible protein A